MQSQIITLKDVQLDVLKPLFILSSTINKTNTTLNMSLTPTGLMSSNKNMASSVVKNWTVPYANFCTEIVGQIPEQLKISIFEGVDFSKKLLGYFGQLATIEIHHDGISAQKLVIKKVTKEGKVALKIDVVAANIDVAYFEFSADEQAVLFAELEDFDRKEVFTLSKDNIQSIKKLLGLVTSPETQKKYVRLYSEDGQIKATDGGFELALFEDTLGLGELKLEIDKSMFSIIDDSSYKVTYAKYDDGTDKIETLILDAVTTNGTRRISLNLLQDVGDHADDIDFADFDLGSGGFE